MTIDSIKTQCNSLTDSTTSWFQSDPKPEAAQTDFDLNPSIATLNPSLSTSVSYPSSRLNSLPSDPLSKNVETEPASLSEKKAPTDPTYLSQILSPFSFLFSLILYPFSSSTQPPSDPLSKNVEIELVSLKKKEAQNVEKKPASLSKKDAQTAHNYTFQILASLSSLLNWLFLPCLKFVKSSYHLNPSSSDRISTPSKKRSFPAYSRPFYNQTTLSLKHSRNLKKKFFEYL